MPPVNRKNSRPQGEVALLPYKQEIISLAHALKGVLDVDVIVVDNYLNRIVNTFRYQRGKADIRINSVVGNIVTTQTLQMVSDRKFFTDCANCPDYVTCELGGVFGTPIMCGEECIGAIAALVKPSQVGPFQKRQASVIDFLTQIAVLISMMVRNTASSRFFEEEYARLHLILDRVGTAVAVTDPSGEILFENQPFKDFFLDEQETGRNISEVLAGRKLPDAAQDRRSHQFFYRQGQGTLLLRDIQTLSLRPAGDKIFSLYVFEQAEILPVRCYQPWTAREADDLDQFFGKSPAMERARQGTLRALRNQLSVLIECPEQGLGDRLAGILSRHSVEDPRMVFKVDCGEDERDLADMLLGCGHGVPGILSHGREGVLCLCGIDRLPMYLQAELSRLLQEEQTGGSPGHMRIIATSRWSLNALAKKGRFSMGLYSAVSRNQIAVPPVSGAPEDARFYLEKYLARYCSVYGRPSIHISGEAWSYLENRRWENLQTIRAFSEYIAARLEGEVLELERIASIFPGEIHSRSRGSVDKNIEAQLRRLLGMGMTKERIAEEMGVSRATLYRWIEKYKLGRI